MHNINAREIIEYRRDDELNMRGKFNMFEGRIYDGLYNLRYIKR